MASDTSSMEKLSISYGLIYLVVVAPFAYVLCLAVYRLHFHPLASFPGSKWAAATGWHEVYFDIIHRGQFFKLIDEMHERYGPIVRITPNEIHIRDSTFFDEIYAPTSKGRRDKDPAWVTLGGAPGATVVTVNHNLHKLRRGALNPFFSKRYIASREDDIKEKIERVCERMKDLFQAGQVIRLDVIYHALVTDVISKIAFGESYECIEKPDFDLPWKIMVMAGAANGVLLRMFPWLLPIMKSLNPEFIIRLDRYAGGLMMWQKRIRAQVQSIIDGNNRGQRTENTIFQSILDTDLPEAEKTVDRLQDEAQTIMGAGSETTGKALAFANFFLNEDKSKLQRLREELSTAVEPDGTFRLTKLEQLPYLTGCVQESVRMIYGVSTRSPRIAYEPIKYHEWTIPSGTPVGMGTLTVCNDPSIFPDPFRFDPTRWVKSLQDNTHLDRYMVAFSKGSRICVGINLAYAELYLGIAYFAWRFTMDNYETSFDKDLHIVRDLFIGAARDDSKGIRARITGLNGSW